MPTPLAMIILGCLLYWANYYRSASYDGASDDYVATLIMILTLSFLRIVLSNHRTPTDEPTSKGSFSERERSGMIAFVWSFDLVVVAYTIRCFATFRVEDVDTTALVEKSFQLVALILMLYGVCRAFAPFFQRGTK